MSCGSQKRCWHLMAVSAPSGWLMRSRPSCHATRSMSAHPEPAHQGAVRRLIDFSSRHANLRTPSEWMAATMPDITMARSTVAHQRGTVVDEGCHDHGDMEQLVGVQQVVEPPRLKALWESQRIQRCPALRSNAADTFRGCTTAACIVNSKPEGVTRGPSEQQARTKYKAPMTVSS